MIHELTFGNRQGSSNYLPKNWRQLLFSALIDKPEAKSQSKVQTKLQKGKEEFGLLAATKIFRFSKF